MIAIIFTLALRLLAPQGAAECVVAVDTDHGPARVLAPCGGPRPVFLAFGEEWI